MKNEPTAGRQHILVINNDVCDLIARILESEYEVDCHYSVHDGLKHLRHHSPNLVLMDVDMWDKSGIQGLCEIREVDPDLPVIMITNPSPTDERLKAIQYLHANGLLFKPFLPWHLRQMVRKCITASPASSQLPPIACLRQPESTGSGSSALSLPLPDGDG